MERGNSSIHVSKKSVKFFMLGSENEGRSKENVQAQAGWTLETLPNVSESRMAKFAKPLCNSPTAPPLDQAKDEGGPKDNVPTVCNLAKKPSTEQSSDQFRQTDSNQSSDAFPKSILAQPDASEEENYVTMTSKKSILAPVNTKVSAKEQDENPYMEMCQSIENTNEQQPYEIVCFPDGKTLEPVYMEVNPNSKSVFGQNSKTELPDILKAPKDTINLDNKSDSSDADDEASKDMDSLDIPNHPRFSLSDSFRPASYYLGASQVTQETQDSSDSELVSPPPIPTSPPPINDIDNQDDSLNSSFCSGEQSKKEANDTQTINDSVYHEYQNVRVTAVSSPKHTRDASVLSYEDFIPRERRRSSISNSTEVVGLLQTSARSTPTISRQQTSVQDVSMVPLYFQHQNDHGSNSSFSQPAPYYYSDLSVNTTHEDNSTTILMLNNQRGAMNGSKRDITHIINPIKCNGHMGNAAHHNSLENTFKLAAEARSVSVDFLNLADKSGQIDKKNIYESDTLKRLKAMDSVSSLQSNPETRNLFPVVKSEKFSTAECVSDTTVRRSHSLEGLLENVLSETVEARASSETQNEVEAMEGSYLWEEDSVWRERLRSASQRHTKSMDDLDSASDFKKIQKKQTRGISRLVTYVNDNLYNMPLPDQKEVEKGDGDSKVDTKGSKENSFIIDREKLRQWDLLSSAPSDAQLSVVQSQSPRVNNLEVESSEGISACQQSDQGKPEYQGKIYKYVFLYKCI